jgi:hypothetical protein
VHSATRPENSLSDKARDASIKEQMAVILRYVNARGQVIERFLGIEEVADTTSYSLKQALDSMLSFHGCQYPDYVDKGMMGHQI